MDRAIVQLLGQDNLSIFNWPHFDIGCHLKTLTCTSLALRGYPDPNFVEMVVRTLSARAEFQQLSEVQLIDETLFEAVPLQLLKNSIRGSSVVWYSRSLAMITTYTVAWCFKSMTKSYKDILNIAKPYNVTRMLKR